MFDGNFRASIDKRTDAVAQRIAKVGITGDHLTVMGLVGAVAAAVVIGQGYLGWGAAVVVASAVPDLMDGPVAKSTNTHSVRGAFFDSTADRITDSLVLGGIAWYLATAHGGPWALLAMYVLGISNLVSYERAKAESLGFDAKGGLMERAERVIVVVAGLAIPGALVPVLFSLAVLTTYTAMYRFAKVWRQASVARRDELEQRGVELPPPWTAPRTPSITEWQARWSAVSRPARRAHRTLVGRDRSGDHDERSTERHRYGRRRPGR